MLRTSLTELLHLNSAPVAIAFVDAAPPGVPHVSAVEPAGCGYWRRAAAGRGVLHRRRRSQALPGWGAHAQRRHSLRPNSRN